MSANPAANFFTGKTILIASPQPWETMRVSKHHYAVEAAKHARHVYFLNPPSPGADGIEVAPLPDHENVSIVTYRLFFPTNLRFHFRPLFDVLMRLQISRIRKAIPALDLFWCFEVNLFSDLRAFGAKHSIYHPVDPITLPHQKKPSSSANLILSVSREILDASRCEGVPAHVIEHGLAECFLETASSSSEPRKGDSLRFGYLGNLLRAEIAQDLLMSLIDEHPEITFVFWGKCGRDEPIPDPRGDGRIARFIHFLRERDNVELCGAVPPEQVATEIAGMDGFLMFYLKDASVSDKSNSHKLLEYLSTGKVVVSSHVSAYDTPERRHLLRMPEVDDDSLIPGIFRETVERMDYYNGPEFARPRREFARDNTYAKQLDRISQLLSGSLESAAPPTRAVAGSAD